MDYPHTLNLLKKNPDLNQLFEYWKQNLNNLARESIAEHLAEKNVEITKFYLEKTDPQFKQQTTQLPNITINLGIQDNKHLIQEGEIIPPLHYKQIEKQAKDEQNQAVTVTE